MSKHEFPDFGKSSNIIDAEMVLIAALNGDKRLLQDLLNKNPKLVNIIDTQGSSPLHYAVKGGHLDCVQFLVEKGANLNIKNKQNKSPYDLAKKQYDKSTFINNINNFLTGQDPLGIENFLSDKITKANYKLLNGYPNKFTPKEGLTPEDHDKNLLATGASPFVIVNLRKLMDLQMTMNSPKLLRGYFKNGIEQQLVKNLGELRKNINIIIDNLEKSGYKHEQLTNLKVFQDLTAMTRKFELCALLSNASSLREDEFIELANQGNMSGTRSTELRKENEIEYKKNLDKILSIPLEDLKPETGLYNKLSTDLAKIVVKAESELSAAKLQRDSSSSYVHVVDDSFSLNINTNLPDKSFLPQKALHDKPVQTTGTTPTTTPNKKAGSNF